MFMIKKINGRNALLFMCFLFVSSSLWLLEAMNERFETDIAVGVVVTNLPEGAEVLWRSNDESVATVNAEGVVTAVAPGETTVTAEVNGKTVIAEVRCTFKITPEDEGAHLETTDATIKVGESFPLYLYNSKSEHIDNIVYLVDDAAICKVEDNYVTALARGTTEIRVIYGDQEFICIVRVG